MSAPAFDPGPGPGPGPGEVTFRLPAADAAVVCACLVRVAEEMADAARKTADPKVVCAAALAAARVEDILAALRSQLGRTAAGDPE